jgi:hypothetical protein
MNELSSSSTVSKMEIVQNEGGREVARSPDYYSLDAIIAVGYRVRGMFPMTMPCIRQTRFTDNFVSGRIGNIFQNLTGMWQSI